MPSPISKSPHASTPVGPSAEKTPASVSTPKVPPVPVSPVPEVPVPAVASDNAAALALIGATSAKVAPLANGGRASSGNAFAFRLQEKARGNREVHEAAGASSLAALQRDLEAGNIPSALPTSALDRLPIPPGGLVLQLDAAAVAGQRVVVRKISHPTRGEGLEFSLKLREKADIDQAVARLDQAGANRGEWKAEKRSLDGEGRYHLDPDAGTAYPGPASSTWVSASATGPAEAVALESDEGYSVRLLSDNAAWAVAGQVELRVFGGSDEALGRAFEAAVRTSGLEDAFASSSEESRALLSQLRTLWQADPARAYALGASGLDGPAAAQEVESTLKAAGIDPREAATRKIEEVFPGHFAPVDPSQGQRYRDLGVQYLFAGVRKLESVIAILEGEGLMSTRERYSRGLIIEGASSAADLCSGGADYAFTRMVTSAATGHKLAGAYGTGDYQLRYGTEVLRRTDWFAYPQDQFGATRDEKLFKERKYGAELVAAIKTGGPAYPGQPEGSYATFNETMFATGIPNRELEAIYTQDEAKRMALLSALTERGITEVAGKPISEFVQVRQFLLDDDEASGVSP